MNRLGRVALISGLVAACSSRGASDSDRPIPTPRSDGASMTDSDERIEAIKKVVPDAVAVERLDLGAIGLRGYWVTLRTPAGAQDLDRGLGMVSRDDATFLRGKDGMKAVIDTGTQDALVLARAAMSLLEQGGEPITDIERLEADYARREAREAKVTPPAMSGTKLVYWSYYRPLSRPGLLRSTVDLATLEVKRSTPAADEDPVDRALRDLATDNDGLRRNAIEGLVKACADPRAPTALAETLRSHAKPDARALAAENLARCHDADAVPALIAALEKDTHSDVRSWCISALVEIGDTRARAALERAASNDPDEGIRRMAERWLKKLK